MIYNFFVARLRNTAFQSHSTNEHTSCARIPCLLAKPPNTSINFPAKNAYSAGITLQKKRIAEASKYFRKQKVLETLLLKFLTQGLLWVSLVNIFYRPCLLYSTSTKKKERNFRAMNNNEIVRIKLTLNLPQSLLVGR